MPREPKPRQTDVKKQIEAGLKSGGLALALLLLLWWCVREPLRRWTLHHPRFEAQPPQRTPSIFGALAVGDLDGNAWADLIVCAGVQQSPQLVVFSGSAQGPMLGQPLVLPDPFSALDLCIADLDGDGLEDILGTPAGEGGLGMVVWWNEGQLRFARASVRAPLRFVDVIDEDRDGHPDLAGVSRNFEEIRVHRLSGREVAAQPAVATDLFDNTVRDFAAAHLDRSGMDCAAVARERVRVFRSGGFVPDPTTYFNLPVRLFHLTRANGLAPCLVMRDLNGDERPDLAYIDDQSVSLQLGLGGGKFAESHIPVISQAAQRLVAGDFDGDGRPDLLTVALDAQTIQILFQR